MLNYNNFLCNNNCNYNNILCSLLYNLPLKLNIGNHHYITGKDIVTFSSFASVEKYLTCLTCNFRKKC